MAREACAHHEHEDERAPFRRVAPCSSLSLSSSSSSSSSSPRCVLHLPSPPPLSSSSSVYFFTVRELSTSTFMCTHACSFVSLKLDVFPTPMTVKSGLFFLPRERSSFRGSRSTKASARNASIESRESSSTLKLYYTSSEQIVRFDRFFFLLLYFD